MITATRYGAETIPTRVTWLSNASRTLGKIVFVSVTLVMGFAFSSTAQAACDPSPNEVSFFTDAGFKGQCVVKNFGDYANSSAIGLPNDFDLISAGRQQCSSDRMQG